MIAAYRIYARLRCAAVALFAWGLVVAAGAPALAVPPSTAAFNSNESILKWINGYRHRPDPERLPSVVRALSALAAMVHDVDTAATSCCMRSNYAFERTVKSPRNHRRGRAAAQRKR